MKAFIRDTEIYTEPNWTPFTINHLDWTHTANPDGDGYALAYECPSDAIASDFDITSETVTIGEDEGIEGATYTVVTRLYATLNVERYTLRINEVSE